MILNHVMNRNALNENCKLIGGISRWALTKTTEEVLDNVADAVDGINCTTVQHVLATQHATKHDEKELVHRLILWTVAKDEAGRWKFELGRGNKIHYYLTERLGNLTLGHLFGCGTHRWRFSFVLLYKLLPCFSSSIIFFVGSVGQIIHVTTTPVPQKQNIMA